MVPSHITPHYLLFCLYLEIEDKEKAIQKAKDILSMTVKITNTTVVRVKNRAKIYLEEMGYPSLKTHSINANSKLKLMII